MNFKEAMEAVQSGSKVTRKEWIGSIHFEMQGEHLVVMQPVLEIYQIVEDTLISNGWIVNDPAAIGEFKFYDIIPYLLKGAIARLSDWPIDSSISYSVQSRSIIYKSMKPLPFHPDMDSMISTDWIIV